MDRPPAYLLWFLLRIRKHSGEADYLAKRFEHMEMERMGREAHMLRELHRLGFIALPDETDEKVYDPLRIEDPVSGVTFIRMGTEHRIPYAPMFELLPAGHYILRELAFDALGKGLSTALTAIAGVVAGLLIAG